MKMKPILRAAIAGLVFTATAGAVQAAGGSLVCKDSFRTLKEIRAEVGGSPAFINIVNQYVTRWDAQEARQLCEDYAAGRPVTITCLDGQRDWTAIKASIPEEYFGLGNKQLAATHTAELQKGTGYEDALAYCRGVGAIE